MKEPVFEEYLKSLSAVDPKAAAADPEILQLCVHTTAAIASLDSIDQKSVAGVIQSDPAVSRVLATIAGLSQERFKTWLTTKFDTAGWIVLSREQPDQLIEGLDEDFDLIALLNEQCSREWTWADVLARAMAPLQRAGSSVRQGRNLEDRVEEVIEEVGLAFVARTRFQGRAGESAPADFGIPSGGEGALIAVAVKGFDSTGSKLTDARREVEEMAKVRTPNQFIFAIVDGQGWIRRQSDLRQIHLLWTKREIDGLYNQSSLPDFQVALRAAARRIDLLG